MADMEVVMRRTLMSLTLLLVVVSALPAAAQITNTSLSVRRPRAVSLSGPRFGFTALSDGIVDKLAERDIVVRPSIAQFGWQFENQITGLAGGLTAVNEWVVLAGGMDQGVVIPSVSWLVGLRTREGTEFGVGPNVTPAGVALAFAAGATIKAGSLNIPLNIAVVPSRHGTRISFLTGFNIARR
jgi:hypothetical protein